MRAILVLSVLVLLAGVAKSQDVTFEAHVNKNPVIVGDRFQLSLTLNVGGMGGGENLKPPELGDFYVLSGPNKSSSMRIINGSVSSAITYGYVLQPREMGEFLIGPATVEADGMVYSTEPIKLEVVDGTPEAGAPPAQNPDVLSTDLRENLFLKAEVDRRSVLHGEQINLVFKLYTRVSVQNYSISKSPTLTGFWGEEIENPKNVSLSTETIDGKQFRVGVIRRVALFPTQSGKLEISPMELQTVVQVQSKKRFDPFESFFRDPFGKSVNYTVKSDPIAINVQALPPGAPESFKGAVGRFSMSATLDKNSTGANEPVALKVVVSGTGNIKLLESPLVEIPAGFENFSPKVSEDVVRNKELVSGRKTFEYLLIPRYPGSKTVKPVEFSYFDLRKRDYVVLESPPLGLEVKPGSAGVSSPLSGPVREGVEVLSEDIRFIKVGGPELSRRDEQPYKSPLFLGMVVLPLLTFAGAFVVVRRREAAAVDQVGYRNKRAARVAQKGLRDAEKLLKESDDSRFYDEVAKAVWKYLGDKLNIQQAEMSMERAVQQILDLGIDAETTSSLQALLGVCEMARFAPASSQVGKMQETYDEAMRVISGLEKQLKAK